MAGGGASFYSFGALVSTENWASVPVVPWGNRPVAGGPPRKGGTWKGKLAALKEARRHVRERDPEGKLQLVGLTDGDRSLQSRMKYVFPGILLILDLVHVLEYLWKAAHVFHKEGSVEAEQWVTERLRMLLTGKLSDLLRELKQSVPDSNEFRPHSNQFPFPGT